jgi:predicted PurR-regulated permease PerM
MKAKHTPQRPKHKQVQARQASVKQPPQQLPADTPAPQKYHRNWFILFFIAALILAILVIRPFIASLIIGAVIAYVLYPLHKRLVGRVKSEGLSAGIIVAVLLLVFTIPIAIAAAHIAEESYDIYTNAKDTYQSQLTTGFCKDPASTICDTYTTIKSFADQRGIDLGTYITTASGGIIAGLIKAVTSFVFNLPTFFIHLLITLFIIFYLLIDGESVLRTLKNALPLKTEDSERIFNQFDDVIYATVYGSIILALIQGILALIGFVIFGVNSPVILAILTVIFSFVPLIGTAIVWLPASVMMILSALSDNDHTHLMKGIGLLIYGLIIISMSDNLLRPKIVGSRANVHPLLILLGVFGGIAMFGFAGIIIGPLILTLFMTALKIYEQDKEHILTD